MLTVEIETITLAQAVRRYLHIIDTQAAIPYEARQILKRESLSDVRAALEREEPSHEDS